MPWRPARSLETLRAEVNARWSTRSKASDGLIGDQSHAASSSDHNPNSAGVVCAFDITHDPNGPTAAELFELIRTSGHPDLKYVIANRQYASRKTGFQIRAYTGVDPHTSHVHVSVGVGPDGQSQPPYDDTTPWLTEGDDDLSQAQVDQLIKEIRDNAVAVATDVKSTKTDVDTVAKKLDQVNQRLDAIEAKLK